MTRGSRPGGGEGAERTALLAAARAGSEDAFRDLFTPDLDLAWRMALRITGSEASADDALQAGLISALAKGVLGGDLNWPMLGYGALAGLGFLLLDEALGRTS